MAGLLTSQHNLQAASSLIDGLPEEAARYIPDAVSQATNKPPPKATLLNTVGISAGATAAFNGPKVWKDRFGKNVKAVTKSGKALVHGKALGRLLSGSVAGAVATAPIEYAQARIAENYEGDKKFHGGHFAAIAAPSLLSATIGTGSFTNTMEQLGKSGTQGVAKTVKNILSPTKIMDTTKKEVGNVKTLLGGGKGKIGKGLLAAALMGTSLIDPALYAYRTLTGKKKEGKMEKTAAKWTKVERDATAKIVAAGATLYAGDKLLKKRKKQLRLSYRSLRPTPVTARDYELMRSI